MRTKCDVIKAFAADFEQLQRLTKAACLILLLWYFDGTCDCKVAAALIKVGQMF